jgi:hypothetical protein
VTDIREAWCVWNQTTDRFASAEPLPTKEAAEAEAAGWRATWPTNIYVAWPDPDAWREPRPPGFPTTYPPLLSRRRL